MHRGHSNIAHHETTWRHIAVGSLLLIHFAIVCAIKTSQGFQADVFWMSHVALALAGAGFLLNSRLFIGAALTSVGVSHLLWLFDFCIAQCTGSNPMLITQYLHGADMHTWIATTHHFYLLPLLLLALRHFGKYKLDCFWLAVALTVVATVLSRAMLPESRNVNWAFAIMPGSSLRVLHWANAQPAAFYLCIVLAWQIIIHLLPTAVLLRLATRNWPEEALNTEGTEKKIGLVLR